MKRVLELIISLIATAATYALMHVVLFMDLFKFQHKLPVYVPTVIAVIVGLIFYFLLATPLAGLLLKRLNQTEERLSKMNLKELSLSVIGCIVGLGSGEPHRYGIQWLWRTGHVYCGAVEHPVRDSGDSRCQKKEG